MNCLDVVFDRNPSVFTEEAQVRAKSAQLKLENYYKVTVDAAVERNGRYVFPDLHFLIR